MTIHTREIFSAPNVYANRADGCRPVTPGPARLKNRAWIRQSATLHTRQKSAIIIHRHHRGSGSMYSFAPAIANLRRRIVLLTTIALVAGAMHGQSRGRVAAAEPTPLDTVYSLGEVVVTAVRTGGTTLATPLAITVIEKTAVFRTRAAGIDELLTGIPGVLAQSRYGGQDVRLTIRGFGARGAGERSNSGTSRGVRIFLDGIPITEPDGRTSFDLLDLAGAGRIEVIRSNASALWGNAAGGIVNVISNTFFPRPFVRAQWSGGSFGFNKVRAEAGGLLGEGRFYLSVGRTESDGWRNHSASSATLVNGVLNAPLEDRTQLDLSLTAADVLFRIPGALTPSQFSLDPRQAQDDPDVYNPTYVQRDERRHNRLARIGANLFHDFDGANSVTVMAFATPKYLERSERNTFREFTRYHVGGSASYAHRAPMNPDVSNMVKAGLDYELQDGSILFYSLVNGGRGTLQTDKREKARTFGAFLADELLINDRIELSAGARYDDITYTNEQYYSSDPGDPLLNGSRSFRRVTPKAGITYRISPAHSVYVNLGGGLEVPAGNETDPPSTFGEDTLYAINPLLDASKSVTVELGSKQVVVLSAGGFMRSLQYDVALYCIQVTNDIIPYRGGRFYFTAGETRRIGVETGVGGDFAGGLLFQGSLTLGRSRYEKYTIDSVYYGNPGHTADLSGNKAAGIPGLYYDARMRFAPASLQGFFVSANVTGVGRYFADDYNAFVVPPYTIWNVLVGIDGVSIWSDGLVLDVAAGFSNLFNRTCVSSPWINPDRSRSGEPILYDGALPRTFVASVGVSWEW